MQTKIQHDFIAKKKQNKGMIRKCTKKLMLNKLKVMTNYTSIYTHLALSWMHFFFQFTCGACSPCVPMCTHVWTKTQLRMNLNLTKSELRIN
jgi:NADH:ubiquinone oxidoreductase subunit F (NADH-binding)